jgi:acetolactate synthase-1/2/3 large subunit
MATRPGGERPFDLMQVKVSELIVKYMERLGIEHVFGMPGAHILPVYDSLYDSGIEAVLAKHEQGASFMAGGYIRASGRIAACIATAGPGATNLVTGVANAFADKQPLLIITGETPTNIFGKGGLQESSGEGGSIDQTALFKGITKYNRIIERTDYLGQVLNQASRTLLSSSPGPVLLSLPFNIQNEMVELSILDRIKTERRPASFHEASPSISAISGLITQARHPVIIAGFGCIQSGAQHLVSRLSESLGIPVATSLKGKGIISEQSDLSLGSIGVTSNGCAYKYITEKSDLVMILGAGFNERTSYLWDPELLKGKTLVQIDKDEAQLDKVFCADISLSADINDSLTSILGNIENQGLAARDTAPVRDSVSCLKSSFNSDYALFHSGFALIESFFRKLEQRFSENVVIFDDNIIFAQNFYSVASGNRYYPNSGISSLGHAIPATIGAQFSDSKTSFAILGDGGFQMCCMEIMTAVNYKKPLNIVMFNNSSMGLIRKNQHQHYEDRFINCDFANPDYRHLANAFGINHKRVESEEDLDTLFADYDLEKEINLIEIMIDKNLFPSYSSKR